MRVVLRWSVCGVGQDLRILRYSFLKSGAGLARSAANVPI